MPSSGIAILKLLIKEAIRRFDFSEFVRATTLHLIRVGIVHYSHLAVSTISRNCLSLEICKSNKISA